MRTRLDTLLTKVFGPKGKANPAYGNTLWCKYWDAEAKIMASYGILVRDQDWALITSNRNPPGSTTKAARKKEQQLERGILLGYPWQTGHYNILLFNRIP